MKKLNNQNLEDENLVLFPASKNFPVEEDVIDDPLEDLLNEFAHLEDDDYEVEEEVQAPAMVIKGSLGERLSKKMSHLEDSTQRMSFLLSDLESFYPRR